MIIDKLKQLPGGVKDTFGISEYHLIVALQFPITSPFSPTELLWCSYEFSVISASPAPPYGITVLECVRDAMVLGWKQPNFVGGADIIGYFVDYREVIDGVPGNWHEANIRAVSDRAYRVS